MKAVFIDLDGTLLKGNSMKIFMLWLPFCLVLNRAPLAALDALFRIVLRALGVYNHRKMKWHLTRIARKHFDDVCWRKMTDRMLRYVNISVKKFIDSKKSEGCETWLATAAPEEYSMRIARSLGLTGLSATRFTSDFYDYCENKGSLKLNSILEILSEHDLVMEFFLTDHEDDLPTANAFPDKTILVNPSQKALAEMPFARIFSQK